MGWLVGSLLLQSASFQTFMWNSMTSASECFLRSVNIPYFCAVSPPCCFLFPFCVLTADQSVITLRSLLLRSRVPASLASLFLEHGHGSVVLNPHYWLSDRPANVFMLHLTATFVFMIQQLYCFFFFEWKVMFLCPMWRKQFSSFIC